MTLEEAHAFFGSWSKMARFLDIGMSTYQYWRKIGYIPYVRQLHIEKKTNGHLMAREVDAVRLPDTE